MLPDVGLVLVAEVADRGQHRVGRGLPQATQRRGFDLPRQLFQVFDVARLALPGADALQRGQHGLGPYAAGHTFAARLLLRETHKVARQVHHAGVLVGDDQAAGAHDGPQAGQRLVVNRHVQMLGRDAAARRPADLRCFEGFSTGDAAADLVDQFPQADAHWHLDQAGVVDLAHHGENLGALAVLRANAGVPVGPLLDDQRHVGPTLDVVDVGRLAPQPALSGKGRAWTRLADAPLDGCHQRRLLATDEGPGSHPDFDVKVKARSQDIFTQQAVLAHLLQGNLQVFDRQWVLAPNVDETARRADSISADEHSFQHPVGVAFYDAAVHVSAGVALIGVTDDVLDVAGGVATEFPLEPGGKPGPTSPPQPGSTDFSNHLLG